MSTKTISVPIIARVEGEGALHLEIKNNQISTIELRIFEPPRLFEKFLEGRGYEEVLDIVPRVCGICPVAYQMSAAHAFEKIFEVDPGPWVREMRRAYYCGEWIESHTLHIHFLALPDYFGFSSATEMAKHHPDEIKRGMRLHAIGNELIKLFGGRSVNPVGACLGGFYRAPRLKEVNSLLEKISQSLEDAKALVSWISTLSFPSLERELICVSLRHENEYPINEGSIVSNQGLDISIEKFADTFKEFQVPYSNALHCTLNGKSYLAGPLARLNNNRDRLPPEIQQILSQLNIKWPSYNMFHSIMARAIEVYYALWEAKRILQQYHVPELSYCSVKPQAGIGYGCTEAPRGLLWHRYETDEAGFVKSCQMVPPTSQNQACIEEDLRYSLQQFGLDKSDDELRRHSEMIIRNYDPCISCSTHFLDLHVIRHE